MCSNRRGDIIFWSDFFHCFHFSFQIKNCLIPLSCSRKKTGLFTRDTTSFRPCLTAETSAGTCAIPLRCNRRNLSQPYRFRLLFSRFGAPLGSHVRSAAPPPLSACKTGIVFGGVLCKFAHADVLSSSLCFVFMHWFYANTFTSICKPQKSPPYGDFFIFSPFGGPFIHRNNYLWFALITDIAASSATTVRSL
mgnify:FL=1